VAVAALVVVVATFAGADGAKPNIVHILADDLGYGMVGLHNNGSTISPNINQLYSGGLDLRQMHVHKWCAPTRASIMTGRLPHHHGVDLKPYLSPEQHLAVHRDFTFLPQMLKDAG
jgi:arylsulfatase A-like enzyme